MTLNIPALAALLEAATPGPWRVRNRKVPATERCPSFVDSAVDDANGFNVASCGPAPSDADLIVAAVNNLPALLRIAQAAVAWRDNSVHTGDANCMAGDHDDCTEADYLKQLAAAIDSIRPGCQRSAP